MSDPNRPFENFLISAGYYSEENTNDVMTLSPAITVERNCKCLLLLKKKLCGSNLHNIIFLPAGYSLKNRKLTQPAR